MPDPSDRILAAEDAVIKELQQAYLDSVAATLDATRWDDIALAGLSAAALDLIRWQPYEPAPALVRMIQTAGEIRMDTIGGTVGAKMDLALVNPQAVAWAEQYAAAEVAQISEASRAAIREIVREGALMGVTPQRQAQEIRSLIGLDSRRARAVINYRDGLLEKGLSYDEASRKAAKYADQLLRDRSLTIAVNEATNVSAEGFYLSTKDAVERGILPSREYEGYRIVTPDERLCPSCASVAGEARELPDGVYQSSGSHSPKLHIKCRCVEGIRRKT